MLKQGLSSHIWITTLTAPHMRLLDESFYVFAGSSFQTCQWPTGQMKSTAHWVTHSITLVSP